MLNRIKLAVHTDFRPQFFLGHVRVTPHAGAGPQDNIDLYLIQGAAHGPVGADGGQLGAVALDDLGPVKGQFGNGRDLDRIAFRDDLAGSASHADQEFYPSVGLRDKGCRSRGIGIICAVADVLGRPQAGDQKEDRQHATHGHDNQQPPVTHRYSTTRNILHHLPLTAAKKVGIKAFFICIDELETVLGTIMLCARPA